MLSIASGSDSALGKLGQGTWKLEVCPMDGGELTLSGAQVTTAWRREDGIFIAVAAMRETRLLT